MVNMLEVVEMLEYALGQWGQDRQYVLGFTGHDRNMAEVRVMETTGETLAAVTFVHGHLMCQRHYAGDTQYFPV